MATETLAGPLGEIRAVSTAGGGTALSTTAVALAVPNGTRMVQYIPRNFSTAVVLKLARNPYLLVYKTADSLATVTDYSENAQDGSTSTDVTLSSLDTLANGDALWLGGHLPFRGVQIDVDAANGTVADIAGHYWNGSSMSALTVTDGTASGGATLAVDGAITWTMPTDWVPVSLVAAGSAAKTIAHCLTPLYWVRLTVSAAMDSSTTLNSLLALNRSTAYAEYPLGTNLEERFQKGLGYWGAIEALTDAGTANLIVNAISQYPGGFS